MVSVQVLVVDGLGETPLVRGHLMGLHAEELAGLGGVGVREDGRRRCQHTLLQAGEVHGLDGVIVADPCHTSPEVLDIWPSR